MYSSIEAELGEDLERRRLRGRGARAVVDSLLRLEQRHAVTEARAGQRSDRADRSRADHQDVAPLHFCAAIILSRCAR